MRKSKKKGYALMITLVTVMLLSTLAACVLEIATSTYIRNVSFDKNNKLKLAAESGAEKGINLIKEYYLQDGDGTGNSPLLNPEGVTANDITSFYQGKNDLEFNDISNGIDGSITFSTNDTINSNSKFQDDTGRQIDYIKITATAYYISDSNKRKSVEVLLDKTDYTNIYYDRLFGDKSAITVANNGNSMGEFNFVNNSNSNVSIEGNLNIEGNALNFNVNNNFSMGDGDINVKLDNANLNSTETNLSLSKIQTITGSNLPHLYKNDVNYNNILVNWKNRTYKSTDILGIINNNDIQSDSQEVSKEDNYIKTSGGDNTDNNKPPTLVSFKVSPPSGSISFQDIVDGSSNNESYTGSVVNGIYTVSLQTNSGMYSYILDNIIQPRGLSVSDYGRFFKFIIVDGNLSINDDQVRNYDNYVIYCTGTVTFDGSANFYNSSIFANRIIFSNPNNTSVNFNGINTDVSNRHAVNGGSQLNFDDTDKRLINQYLIRSLENYGNYIQFRILKWTEQ